MDDATTLTCAFAAAVADALRAARYARVLSQRDLATELGVGKSTVARLESGALNGPLQLLHDVLTHLGFEITLHDRRPPPHRQPPPPPPRWRSPSSPPPPPGQDDDIAATITHWRHRVDDEDVRDAAGRRPPAHRHLYPRLVPHRWWHTRHPHTPWDLRPTWSWSRYLTPPHIVLRLGPYPRTIGLPPRGGAPMQGYPP